MPTPMSRKSRLLTSSSPTVSPGCLTALSPPRGYASIGIQDDILLARKVQPPFQYDNVIALIFSEGARKGKAIIPDADLEAHCAHIAHDADCKLRGQHELGLVCLMVSAPQMCLHRMLGTDTYSLMSTPGLCMDKNLYLLDGLMEVLKGMKAAIDKATKPGSSYSAYLRKNKEHSFSFCNFASSLSKRPIIAGSPAPLPALPPCPLLLCPSPSSGKSRLSRLLLVNPPPAAAGALLLT
ncbi:hypothetical protein BDK51DRAFT_40424 [Blyttiomyces helicus]|uniref:Uncharacterized protein n=1 Tax=Blyttiomyces helicus TaxID=388810 RepID=A0A4P9WA29_9FUNG|nr:hypothetical protein BDK51DRAFT_40424 [Blyttiomyces helicus]|eukprot:RKO89429.1 hypothetical protein BDK51DRAFT_40424 [Blyttiomyces helicus]